MDTILITGFKPFTTGQGLVLTDNPTGRWAKQIGDGLERGVSATLPVSFQRTKQTLRELFSVHRPRVWVGLGFAPHRSHIDVEYVALNLEHATRGDNDMDSPTLRPIVHGGPPAFNTRF
ncbi:MAG: pyroglutamyl-peptidase I, partial [Bradymonadia bacterium]